MGRRVQWPPSVHCHKSGRSFIRVRGKDYYLPGAPGSPEAKAEYARLVSELASPDSPQAHRAVTTVADVCAAFLTHAVKVHGEDGRETASHRVALKVVCEKFASLPAADFKVPQLRAVREAMTARWCRNVTNRNVVRVRTAWRWAEEESALVPPGAWAHLRALKPIPRSNKSVRQTADRQGVEWERVRRTLRELPPVGRAMVLLQWFTGMRPSEVRLLRACEVRQGPDGLLLYDTDRHKTFHIDGSRRVAVIGRMGQRVLRKWLAGAAGPDAYLFPLSRGGKRKFYSRDSYAQMIRRACERAGVEAWTAYEIRHEWRTRVTALFNLDFARATMGHRSIVTTAGYGQAIDLKLAYEVARKVG